MSFDAYPGYKHSRIDWLGEVPDHWQVASLRWYATIQGGIAKGKSYDADTPVVDLPYLRVANVQDGYFDLSSISTVTVASSEVDRYLLQTGDVLMNEGGDNDKLGRGAVWVGQIENCLHQNHVFSIRPNQYLSPHWLSMFTRSASARSYFYLYSKQSTNLASISSSNVMSCPLPVPPIDEQRQILNFLDHETAKIDALIREQERLIELLDEKRQAVISHAVTKGLDPDVPMKDSGVEWLGEVPAHWKTLKIRYVANVFNGATPSKSKPDYWADGSIPWVSSGDLNRFWIENTSNKISPLAVEECNMVRAPAGSVLVGLVGQGKTRGLSAKLNIPSTINQNVAAIVPDERKLDTEYLHSILQHLYPAMRQAGRGGQQAALNCELVSDLTITMPEKNEQKTIVDYLEDTLSKMEVLINQSKKQITLLKERRSALITAAVTGKVDVRNWQSPNESAVEKLSEVNEETTA